MTNETAILLIMGSFAILLCGWAYYHCFERQREKYEELKKAFAEDFPNSWGEKPVEKPKKRPYVRKATTRKEATVATKPGLYANIHAKQKRIEKEKAEGKPVEKMRKPGTKGAPTAQAFKKSAKTAKKK